MASETSSSVTGTMFGQELVSNGGAEGSSFLITRHKLTGHNYHQWAKAVLMFITGRGKDEYLFSTTEPPKKDDKRFKVWNTENNLVMSWLINAMDTEIGQNFLFYDAAHEIWMAAKETYSDSDNIADLFDIKGALHDLRQDKSLDEVRGRILGTKPLPTIQEAFSEVRREESRKKLMMGTMPFSNVQEGSTLISQGSTNIQEGTALVSQGSTYDARQKKGRPWCDHCRRPGHTKETCWKIHGKPADWKSNKEKEA
ncbi:uncharacterized protein LOC109121951 [Vitis vinifera]|uniref:uncharacterized protein LOC109121951 n=1 Tax=Vitis vinifera TaxID=29760 RepID=UPI0008FEBD59|nr:uncharacterized protein LOC109121951 [Vitis vinifera]|eukprot:XP_019073380.1 PREDICTED: uncharacterized protein LOC109121953 [Vitis vinifera]